MSDSSSDDSDFDFIDQKTISLKKQQNGNSTSEDDEIKKEENNKSKQKPMKGQLVYLFAGDQNSPELVVIRNISMKYGLTQWNIMTSFLPWRPKPALRATICRLIKKQALSEYDGIRADPLKILKDNEEAIRNIDSSEHIYKGGVIVNNKWDRSTESLEAIKKKNINKYIISEEEAEDIHVPIIMSIDYLKQQCYKRYNSLLLYRAALISESAKRKGEQSPDLQMSNLSIISGTDIKIIKQYQSIPVTFGTSLIDGISDN